MPWGLPRFSVTLATLSTADIMVLAEDRSEPSEPVGGFDVIGSGFYASKKSFPSTVRRVFPEAKTLQGGEGMHERRSLVVWEQLGDYVGSGLQLAQVCAWGVGGAT